MTPPRRNVALGVALAVTAQIVALTLATKAWLGILGGSLDLELGRDTAESYERR